MNHFGIFQAFSKKIDVFSKYVKTKNSNESDFSTLVSDLALVCLLVGIYKQCTAGICDQEVVRCQLTGKDLPPWILFYCPQAALATGGQLTEQMKFLVVKKYLNPFHYGEENAPSLFKDIQ